MVSLVRYTIQYTRLKAPKDSGKRMREYLSMMLVPVSTLLAGTAEPCCRKACALTGGLGKVLAGRSKARPEFILFFRVTPPASTWGRPRGGSLTSDCLLGQSDRRRSSGEELCEELWELWELW
ncbi:hypothetical protein EYF80_059739 [Liparis tanakae]|uniref:Uncharacterized protein n=1 Tax=Liparis tanakae TaxID=230148 RepID=A0A4Z2EMV1_9TELE|nr:hypothetical protein EYF80_059739 [Liparis tanakae]